jgi:lysophospholipase L1-like esterase
VPVLPCKAEVDQLSILHHCGNAGGLAVLKNFVKSGVVFVLALLFALGCAEGILRLKNSSMQNYDIEMWRYAKELKRPSEDPLMGHEHVPNDSAILQSVEIRTNNYGLRGPDISESPGDTRRILVLGSSITLGWGVEEDKTFTSLLENKFEADGQDVEVLNAGIGNYNTQRYVERFFRDLAVLKPTDIVVHYFVNDAEHLDAGGGNVLLRNSELAVTVWIAINRVLNAGSGDKTLVDHYRDVYEPDQPGYQDMLSSLEKLSDYAQKNGIRLYLAMIPDVHNLEDYPFQFIHDRMKMISNDLGYKYVDLFPGFKGLSQEEVWAMPGDPHPNAYGHEVMADEMYPALTISN